MPRHLRHSAAFALWVVALLAAPLGLSAQERVFVSGAVTCADCVIAMDTVLTLGGLDAEGSEVVSYSTEVVIDSRGRILVTDRDFPEIFVFDSDGRLLRTVGRRGEGPGEYQRISHVNAGPRYIHVFEYHTGRTVLDLDFGFVRRDRFAGQFQQSYVMESDEVVLMGNIGSAESAGHLLHLIGPSGDIRSYGADESTVYRGNVGSAVVTGSADTLWSLDRRSTDIYRWEVLPRPRIAEIWDRTVDEWEGHDHSASAWPRPTVVDVMRDEYGLWIAWNAPDPNRPPGGGVLINTEPHQTLFDGWVDLVDPSTGETIARYHGDDSLIGVVRGAGYLIAYHEREAGVPYIHLLDPRLTGGLARRQ